MNEENYDMQQTRAARSVDVTFNNSTKFDLHLRGTSIPHGIFKPGPPDVISAGKSATWRTESNGIFTGTEALAYYTVESSTIEFHLYWNNPSVGSNSYSSSVINNNGKYAISTAGTSGNNSSVTFSAYMKGDWSYNSWMKDIDSDKLVSQLSIPGTHNSCATYSPDGDILGVVICQDSTITNQLENGTRFLDIRCRATDGVFTIHHGLVYQNINFGEVLNECIGFLSKNPSEIVFMRIKQEYSEVSDTEFIKIFNEKYGSFHSHMYLNSDTPTVAQVRGKIVVLSDVSGLPGIPWNGLQVQDRYNIDSIISKVAAISEHFDKAIHDHSSGGKNFFVNFISQQGTPMVLTIREAAERLNPQVISMLHNKGVTTGGIGVGIVPMDFPNHSGGVIYTIIESNY